MALLLTNDDGIDAPGLAALAEALAGLDDIVISAPAENNSGVGGGITMNRSLAATRHAPAPGGFPRHAIDSTPAVAVKYGLRHIMAGNAPRLVVSGINKGANVGYSIRNSGTLGAAYEAAESGIPALAVSIPSSNDHGAQPNWNAAKHFARMLAERMFALSSGHEPFVLNLNVPSCDAEKVRGLLFARAGDCGRFDLLPADRDSRYQLGARRMDAAADSLCDGAALEAGYAVATPLRVEMTDLTLLTFLKEQWTQ